MALSVISTSMANSVSCRHERAKTISNKLDGPIYEELDNPSYICVGIFVAWELKHLVFEYLNAIFRNRLIWLEDGIMLTCKTAQNKTREPWSQYLQRETQVLCCTLTRAQHYMGNFLEKAKKYYLDLKPWMWMKLLTWYQSVTASILVLEFQRCLIQLSAEMHFPSSLCGHRQWTYYIQQLFIIIYCCCFERKGHFVLNIIVSSRVLNKLTRLKNILCGPLRFVFRWPPPGTVCTVA